MSGADLKRCQLAQGTPAAAAEDLTDARRVALAAESEDGLQRLDTWAGGMCTRSTDVTFKLLVRSWLCCMNSGACSPSFGT